MCLSFARSCAYVPKGLCVLGHIVRVKNKRIALPHSKVCDKKCTSNTCTHRAHRKGRQHTMDKAALVAGFKVLPDGEFTSILNEKLRQAGIGG